MEMILYIVVIFGFLCVGIGDIYCYCGEFWDDGSLLNSSIGVYYPRLIIDILELFGILLNICLNLPNSIYNKTIPNLFDFRYGPINVQRNTLSKIIHNPNKTKNRF